MPSFTIRLLRSRLAWTVAVAAVLALTAVALTFRLYPTAYQRGMHQASIDHQRGHCELQLYGGPPPHLDVAKEEEEFARLLTERYGVELHYVAGCVVTEELLGYADGYNSVSERLLKEKYGKDIFEECRRLAHNHQQDARL